MTIADVCPDLETLSQLVDRELTPGLTITTQRHVELCPRCRTRVTVLERATHAGRTAAAIPAAPVPSPPPTDACLSASLLAGWVTRALAGAELRRAESHLEACDRCLVAAREALGTVDTLSRAPHAVPVTLQAQVAAGWPEPTASVTRLAIAIARTGLRLLEQHVVSPLLSIEPQLVALPAHRTGEVGTALGIRLRAEEAEIRATLVPDDDAVDVTLLLLGKTGEPLTNERLYLRQYGSAIFSARTDANGELRLPRLEPGLFEVAFPRLHTTFHLDLRA
jgi:hypothetical protein